MNWQGKRVLVTGSSGVIGRVLVKMLVDVGARVLSVDIASAETIEPPVEHIQVDLAREIPARLRDFDAQMVFHLAATFERTEEVAGYWKTSFDNNVLLSHMLLRALVAGPSLETFVFASSYLIYNPEQYIGVPQVHFLKETDPVAPRNLVGMAKYFAEQELAFIADTERQLRAISARIYRVYGRGSRDIISRWVRAALKGETLQVYGKAGCFDYIFADDVAQGLIKLVEAQGACDVVNLGSGAPRSVGDIVSILRSELPDLRVDEVESNGPVEASCADMTLFRQLTGWQPQTTLEQGISQIIAYERQGRKKS